MNAIRDVDLPASARLYLSEALNIALAGDFGKVKARVQHPASGVRANFEVARQIAQQTLRGVNRRVLIQGFVKIFIPLIANGIGVAAFFCFMFSWVELLLARTLTATEAKPITSIMTRTVSASGMDWGLLAAAGVLCMVPGAIVIWFVRNHIAKGFALGRV